MGNNNVHMEDEAPEPHRPPEGSYDEVSISPLVRRRPTMTSHRQEIRSNIMLVIEQADQDLERIKKKAPSIETITAKRDVADILEHAYIEGEEEKVFSENEKANLTKRIRDLKRDATAMEFKLLVLEYGAPKHRHMAAGISFTDTSLMDAFFWDFPVVQQWLAMRRIAPGVHTDARDILESHLRFARKHNKYTWLVESVVIPGLHLDGKK